MVTDSLADLLGSGSLHSVMLALSLLGMLIAIAIWVMEFSGYTLQAGRLVQNNVPWNAVTIAVIAISASLYIAGRPIQVQLIPGIGGLNPTLALAPVLALLFGLPGAVGITFSMPIGDAISGALTLGSVAGFLSHTFLTWIPYKMIRQRPDVKSVAFLIPFYFWAILVGPVIHAIVVPGWLDLTNVLPPAVAWGGVTVSILINHGVFASILAPIALVLLYPIVKARGLYWRDRYSAGN